MSDEKLPWTVQVESLECSVKLTVPEFKALEALDYPAVVLPRLAQAGAVANTVEFKSYLGSVVHLNFTARSEAAARGVMDAVKGLLREQGMAREEQPAAEAAPEILEETLSMVLVFGEDVRPRIQLIGGVAGYLPKFWDVTEQERQVVARLVASPEATPGGRVVRFNTPISGTAEQLERLRAVVKELTTRCDGKRMLLRDSTFVQVDRAFGGFARDLRIAAEDACVDHAERERRVVALEALLQGEDRVSELFADLALKEMGIAGEATDWRALEAQFMLVCEGAGIGMEAMMQTLVRHSPGATSLLRQKSLQEEASGLFLRSRPEVRKPVESAPRPPM